MARTFDPRNKERLLDPGRQELLDPDRLFSILPLRYYQRVADIGCGPGYFSLPLAKYLYDGKLYAVDIQEKMLEAARERLTPYRFSNVEFIKSKDASIPLPADSLDGALMVLVLHEATNRAGLLKAVAGLLQRSGWAVVIEWYKRETGSGPPLEHRLDEDEVKALAEEAKLRFVSERSLNNQHYMLTFLA